MLKEIVLKSLEKLPSPEKCGCKDRKEALMQFIMRMGDKKS